MVSIETLASLQDSTPDVQQWNSCLRKQLALFHRNYGDLTVGTLVPSFIPQDLGMYAAASVQEANTCFN